MIGRVIVVIKAILTRVIFASHGLIAIWRATTIKHDPYYWYLTASILALCFEGIFTLTIKKSQEWKWFCPSVFCYLCSVVPAIWIIEVDKFDRRLAAIGQNTSEGLTGPTFIDGLVPIPQLDTETWATVIEQLLMLILIIGRWMLPKGGLTRDQLSQLLLVYIGTAADIIEFFDTFKEPKIAAERVLCLMILAIWSWSLLQFTFVLTATKSRRTRLTGSIQVALPKAKLKNGIIKVKQVCCTIDVWAILINIILQDAPFLIFRLLLIVYFKIITYMNVFFTCKNTLVIILQFYRLFVVQVETRNEEKKAAKAGISAKLAGAVANAAKIGPNQAVGLKPKRGKNGCSREKVSGVGKEVAVAVAGSAASLRTVVLVQNERPQDRFKGRRKSVSTGNLKIRTGTGNVDIENRLSGSIDLGSDDSPPTYGIIARKKKRSGSQSSSGTESRVKERRRQDTGYSSSSRESAIGSNQQQAQASSQKNGRHVVRAKHGRRQQAQVTPQPQTVNSNNRPNGPMSAAQIENERIWQRRSAIGVVFVLFVVLFVLCMVAIGGGINPRGLVLRETFVVKNSIQTRKVTSTPASSPTTNASTTTTTTAPSAGLTSGRSTQQQQASTGTTRMETETESEHTSTSVITESHSHHTYTSQHSTTEMMNVFE